MLLAEDSSLFNTAENHLAELNKSLVSLTRITASRKSEDLEKKRKVIEIWVLYFEIVVEQLCKDIGVTSAEINNISQNINKTVCYRFENLESGLKDDAFRNLRDAVNSGSNKLKLISTK